MLKSLNSLLGDILAKPVVSSDADLSTTDLDGGEYLLMLACDGVWDQLDECQVFAAFREFVEANDSAGMVLLKSHLFIFGNHGVLYIFVRDTVCFGLGLDCEVCAARTNWQIIKNAVVILTVRPVALLFDP